MVKLPQVRKIKIYLSYSLGSIKKNLEQWKYDQYLYSFLDLISSQKILLRETSAFGLNSQLPGDDRSDRSANRSGLAVIFLPPHGLNSENTSLLPFHRHHPSPFTMPLLFTRPRSPPLVISSFNQRRRCSFGGFGAHHRPDRFTKPVLRFLHQNLGLKVHYTLFFIYLLIQAVDLKSLWQNISCNILEHIPRRSFNFFWVFWAISQPRVRLARPVCPTGRPSETLNRDSVQNTQYILSQDCSRPHENFS